jgi:hypothetical protein
MGQKLTCGVQGIKFILLSVDALPYLFADA